MSSKYQWELLDYEYIIKHCIMFSWKYCIFITSNFAASPTIKHMPPTQTHTHADLKTIKFSNTKQVPIRLKFIRVYVLSAPDYKAW